MNIGRYIIRRILLGIVVLFGVVTLTFVVSRILPVDPVYAWIGAYGKERPYFIELMMAKYHLREPLWIQYFYYLGDTLTGNFGVSPISGHEISYDLSFRFPATFELTMVSLLVTMIAGILLGVISAIRKDTVIDHVVRTLALGVTAVPIFWFGIALQLIFSANLGWFPLTNQSDVTWTRITGFLFVDTLITGNVNAFLDGLRHIVLPALTVSACSIGIVARMTRASMLEVLNEDFVTMARSKGLPETAVVFRHVFRNAAIPPITVLGWTFASLLQGAIITETIFAWPGLGTYATSSIYQIDFPAVMAVTILAAINVVIVNLLTDLAALWADPRTRGT